jgi:hypothetical protein
MRAGDPGGGAQTLEIGFTSARPARREVLHDGRQHQPEIADALADLATVGLAEQLRFRVPARAQTQLRRVVPDAGDVTEAFAPGERLHPVKTETESQGPGLSVKQCRSSHADE